MAYSADDLVTANAILAKLGDKKVTAIDTTTEAGRKIDSLWSITSKELQRKHPWPTHTKRAILSRVTGSKATITGVTKATAGVVTTSGAHGFATADEVCITGIVGMTELNGKTFTIIVLSSTTFSIDRDTTGDTTYVSGGQVGEISVPPPAFDYDFRFEKPSDYQRALRINDVPVARVAYEVSGAEILCNEEEVMLKYIAFIEDSGSWDATFRKLFVVTMQAELAYSLTGSRTLEADLEQKRKEMEVEAKGISGQEKGTPDPVDHDDWLNSRSE